MSRKGLGYAPPGRAYYGRVSDSWNNRGAGSSSSSGSSRGRFNDFSDSSWFHSRKYPGYSSNESYSPRERGGDESRYHHYPREDSSHSGRDYSLYWSPVSSRKHLRTDWNSSQASSSSRSDEGRYGGDGGGWSDFKDRYNFAEDKRRSDTDCYREDRRTNSSHRSPGETPPPPSSRGTHTGQKLFRGSRGMARISQSSSYESLIARRNYSEGSQSSRYKWFRQHAAADNASNGGVADVAGDVEREDESANGTGDLEETAETKMSVDGEVQRDAVNVDPYFITEQILAEINDELGPLIDEIVAEYEESIRS